MTPTWNKCSSDNDLWCNRPGSNPGIVGIVNLSGTGMIRTLQLYGGVGNSTLDLNGGTLQASPGASSTRG